MPAVITPERAAAELLRRHEQKRQWLNEPMSFMREALGEKSPRPGLFDKQHETVEAVRDHRRVAVCSCNSGGKDFIAARIMLWWLSAHKPAKCVIIAPTYTQIASIVWKEARLAYGQSLQSLGGRMLETPRWDITDDTFALGLSTNDPYNLQGFHSPHLLIIISEAHAVDQGDIEALKRLNPERMLLTGNPLTMAGEFYDAFHANAEIYHTIHYSAFDTPNIQQGKMVIPGMVTRTDIEERRQEWGEDSTLYKASILGEFPTSLEDTLIARSWADVAIAANLVPDFSALAQEQAEKAEAEWKQANPPIVACDVARFGNDRTAVIRRDGPVARVLWLIQGRDLMQVAGWLKGYLADHPECDRLVVDDTGLGGGVTDRLREQGITVIAFNGGEQAQNKSRWANAIAEAWGLMADAFRDGRIQLENNPALIGQLCSRRYRIQSDRRIILESKDDLRARGGKSPDLGDALAMTFSPLATRRARIWT